MRQIHFQCKVCNRQLVVFWNILGYELVVQGGEVSFEVRRFLLELHQSGGLDGIVGSGNDVTCLFQPSLYAREPSRKGLARIRNRRWASVIGGGGQSFQTNSEAGHIVVVLVQRGLFSLQRIVTTFVYEVEEKSSVQ